MLELLTTWDTVQTPELIKIDILSLKKYCILHANFNIRKFNLEKKKSEEAMAPVWGLAQGPGAVGTQPGMGPTVLQFTLCILEISIISSFKSIFTY